MIRATTPLQIFTLPFGVNNGFCKELLITYKQNDEIVLEKKLEDVTVEDNVVSFRMTQEESARFCTCSSAEVQLRILTNTDQALASKVYTLRVDRILNDEVLA